MNKNWLLTILALSFFLLCTLKAFEVRNLATFYRSDRVIKLKNFTDARKKIQKEDLELLKLWESMLTGRSAPLSKLIKERYQFLGLNHLFTPSGFHLSAAIFPFMKVLNKKYHFHLLLLLGCAFYFLPGMAAMKRMLVIKSHQKILGMHVGFVCALLMDLLFGSFQTGALSFTYSFLFLGIIYSGVQGAGLIIWFFIAQIFLAYFQNSDISIMLLFFSPILNLGFGLLMPILFLLSFPLWDWQLHSGIFLLRILQNLVDHFSSLSFKLPFIEVQSMTLFFIFLLLFRKYGLGMLLFFMMSSSLNLDRQRAPSLPAKEFVPSARIIRTIYNEKFVNVEFADGKCRMKLVRGFWYENCSPKRRSRMNKTI